jgi:hypothetical protein
VAAIRESCFLEYVNNEEDVDVDGNDNVEVCPQMMDEDGK